MPLSDDPERLVISDADLADSQVEQRVEALRQAAIPQVVRQVGAPSPAGARKWWLSGAAASTISGVLGGVLGWALSEFLSNPDGPSSPGEDLGISTAVWLTLFALGLSAAMNAWEGIQLRSATKAMRSLAVALPLVAVAGFLGGYLVQTMVYEPLIAAAFDRASSAATDAQFEATLINGIRIARSIGFMVIGAILGASLGAAARASKRALNGAIGGAVGGLVGGFLFDFIGEALQSGSTSRFVALVMTGTITGLAVGLVEQARRDHWLEIVTGGMAGKQFILYHDRTEIGSAASCHVTLIKDPSIPDVALALVVQGPRMLLDPVPGAPVSVNGQPAKLAPLNDGDVLQVGATVLRYGQKAQALPQVVVQA